MIAISKSYSVHRAIIFILRKLNLSHHTWNTIYKKKAICKYSHVKKSTHLPHLYFKVQYKIAKAVAARTVIAHTPLIILKRCRQSTQLITFPFCQSLNIIIIMVTLIMEEE